LNLNSVGGYLDAHARVPGFNVMANTLRYFSSGDAMAGSLVKRRVLVVDDEHVVADTLATIFRYSGYDARAVYSAEEGLELFQEWLPELAVIDVYLPGMNGIDLAMLLEVKYPDCKVSLFSGQPGTSELLAAAGRTFEVLAKPVPPGEMLDVVSRLLRPEQDDEPENLPN
jgi:DNA-binding NtrC family response regulator